MGAFQPFRHPCARLWGTMVNCHRAGTAGCTRPIASNPDRFSRRLMAGSETSSLAHKGAWARVPFASSHPSKCFDIFRVDDHVKVIDSALMGRGRDGLAATNPGRITRQRSPGDRSCVTL